MGTIPKPIKYKVSKSNQNRHKSKKAQGSKRIPKKRTVKSNVRRTIAKDRKTKVNRKSNKRPKSVMCSECALALKDFTVASKALKTGGTVFTKAQFLIGVISNESWNLSQT